MFNPHTDNLLVLDIGNTRAKAALSTPTGITQTLALTEPETAVLTLETWLLSQPVAGIGYVASGAEQHPLLQWVQQQRLPSLRVLGTTPGFLANQYATPHTLGADRWAAANAAWQRCHSDALVVDAGTAVTFEYISADRGYAGGAISPGIRMRYEALHRYTARLPLLAAEEKTEWDWIGDRTETALRSGVENGLVAEIVGRIGQYATAATSDTLTVFLTGGDARRFENHLRSTTFANSVHLHSVPTLVLEGIDLLTRHHLHVQPN